MSSLDLRLFEKISEWLLDEITPQIEHLTKGDASDFADYQFRVGYIKGLRDALIIAGNAQKHVLGVERKET